MLRASSEVEIAKLSVRIESINDHGSRGVATMQMQLTDLIKDVVELKVDMNARFEAHQKVHDQDQKARVTGRRWMTTTVIAALVLVAGVLSLLVEILTRIH